MKLLLDTHIWVWSLLDPGRISRAVQRVLNDSQSERWLSPLSLYEAWVLHERGKISLDMPFPAWVEDSLSFSPATEATLTFEVALEARNLNLPHRDPIDRFLIASARVYDLTLVTSDRKIIESRAVSILANG